MARFWCLAAVLALCAAPAPSQSSGQVSTATPSSDLSGLWAAKKWFVPEARGQLIIERTSRGLWADIAGRSAKVRQGGQELSFDLPGDEGTFTGRFEETGM